MPVSNLALLQADDCFDCLFRKDRVALDLHLAETIKLSVDDRDGDLQGVINRGNKRQRQNWKTGAALSQILDLGFAVTRLQIALRPHVVVDAVQIGIQLFAIKNVLILKARDQSRLFDILHLIAKRAALENLAAFELDLSHAHSRAFGHLKSDGYRSCRNCLFAFGNGSIWMTLGRQHFFEHPDPVAHLNRIVDGFLGDSDAALAKSLQDVGLGNALESFKLNVANDGQLFDVKGHPQAAAWRIFDGNAGLHFVEEVERQDRL